VSGFVDDREARIVDIGCANGGLLRALSHQGYKNIIGVDPSPICVQNTQQLEISAFAGSIFSLPKEIGKADCIILSHVLEHIQELRPAVQAVRFVLNDYGWVYVEVPDAQRYKDEVISPFQDFNTEHINHFSQICISNLMGQEGFKLYTSGEKLLETAPGKPYPAIYSIWKKVSLLEPFSFHLMPEVDLLISIQEYIKKSTALLQAIDDKIRSVLKSSPEVIVWGTGQLTMKLLAETVLSESKIVAFVDGNPVNQGKTLCDVQVYSPEKIRNLNQPILIATTLHQEAIIEKIREIGLNNQVILLNGG